MSLSQPEISQRGEPSASASEVGSFIHCCPSCIHVANIQRIAPRCRALGTTGRARPGPGPCLAHSALVDASGATRMPPALLCQLLHLQVTHPRPHYNTAEQAHTWPCPPRMGRASASGPPAPSHVAFCFVQGPRLQPWRLPSLRIADGTREQLGTIVLSWEALS